MTPADTNAASARDVDVWWVDLDRMSASAGRYVEALPAPEREHAARLGRADARAAFAITRAVLRSLLAARLAVPAASLRFAYGRYGKPWLPNHPQLGFNVAHTAGLAVIALSGRGPVGVDVERLDPRVPIDALAERWFSPAEATALAQLNSDDRRRGFFHGWARKEAFLKALGSGLSRDLASFSVTVVPTSPARLLGTPAERWELVDLDAGGAYAAALVTPRSRVPVVPHEFAWPD
ncbi:MAG: 4'-phosphopantetheinyl transferase family protein [Solirubrobacteraceae bacterium]